MLKIRPWFHFQYIYAQKFLDHSVPVQAEGTEKGVLDKFSYGIISEFEVLFFKLLINDIFGECDYFLHLSLTRSIVQNSNSSSGACRCRDNWLRWSRFKNSRSTYVSTLAVKQYRLLTKMNYAKCFCRIKLTICFHENFSFQNITEITVKIFTKIHTICKTETNER